MNTLYEVVYRKPQRTQFVRASKGRLAPGDQVVVQGDEVGKVVWEGCADESVEDVGLVDATRDANQAGDLEQKEQEALKVFREHIVKHGLKMVPVDVEWQSDHNCITFFFSADKRVDFRALVRDLARVYHRRIELRQINPRKVSQRLGGCGACGRELCCSSFLHEMPAVSAREVEALVGGQNLSKLVGACGQLKCCLRYEGRDKKQGGCSGCNSQKLMTIDE